MSVGGFVWYDLATTDPAAAAAFYGSVVGWEAEAVPGKDYALLKIGPTPMAGLMKLPPALSAAGVPPHWSGYIHVVDVDATLATAEAAGATRKFGPEDVTGVGRFAVVADPQGAHFYLFTPTGHHGVPPPMTPGSVGWRELSARDNQGAFGFYAGLFGWTRSQAIDMGPMGTYQLFAYDGLDRGGMMNAPPGVPPGWTFYFTVPDVKAAVASVTAGGGSVLFGPQEVPGGAWTLMCLDPQGARFALVSRPVPG